MGRGDMDRLEIFALARRRLGILHSFDHGPGIFQKRLFLKRQLATYRMQSRGLIALEFNTPTLNFFDCSAYLRRHRTGFRCRHKTFRSEHASKLTDFTHHIGVSHHYVKIKKTILHFFHKLFSALSAYPVEPNSGTFGLLGRAALEAFNRLPERHRFFPGLRAWVGFPRADVPYDRQERAAGQPQQTLHRLVRYAADGIFSFSYLPLRVLTMFGVFVACMGFAAALFFVLWRLTGSEKAPTGFTTAITFVLFLGGIQLIGIGVLGEYLGRVYDEVKQRPNFIVKKRTGLD